MHIPPRTRDRCFKETGTGLFNVLRCDCVTSAFYVTIYLELTYAIIRKFYLYFDWFLAHLLQTLVYFEMHKAPRTGPRQKSAYKLKIVLYID